MKTLRLIKVGARILFLFLAVGFIQSVMAQNFTTTIEPGTLTLVPGESASFVITLTAEDGFTNAVTLTATNLVQGVTAQFAPNPLTPTGTSILTLTAATNADTGSFEMEVIAVGGGITNMIQGEVKVSFGLLPLCYGAFQGTITDATTGKPIPYAYVDIYGQYFANANSNGYYIITNLPLSSSENLPLNYELSVSSNGYYANYTTAYAVCDATNTVNVQLTRELTGSISGSLVSEGGTPLTNVVVMAQYEVNYYTNTDASGLFQFPSLALNSDNTAASYSVSVAPEGYWIIRTNVTVQVNSNSVVDLVAIPVCYQTVYGRVVYSNTGLPATNVTVSITTLNPTLNNYIDISTNTDANGDYTFTNVVLALDNGPRTASLYCQTTGYYEASSNAVLNACGSSTNPAVGPITLTLNPIPPPPTMTNNYGAMTGHVYDSMTGLPITNSEITVYYGYFAYVNSNGAYLITNILVGTDAQTNEDFEVFATANNYFESITNAEIYAGETNLTDFHLLRQGYGYIQGTVLNSETGLPVTNVFVDVGGNGVTTGATGQFSNVPITLNSGNRPTEVYLTAEATGYWTTSTNTIATNGVTNMVTIELLPVCQGASVVGNVVNATTQAPITNATISTGYPSYLSTMTDSNGNFSLTNITVGNDNSPLETTITATAPGFNSQSKTITIFCGATISTEFGAPETVFGAIDGYVTNILNGQPLTNVFIGSSFGSATSTDTNGYYFLGQVPLGPNGSNRTWTVTAIPTDFPAQTKSVVVSSDMTNLLSFGFGQPLTELVVSASGTPDPDVVGSNLLYTLTLTNLAAGASNVVLSDTLPPGVTFVGASVTNNPGGAFGLPVVSNGVITITAPNLGSNSGVVLLITVTPTVAGALTNLTTVTSETPDKFPGSSNQTATVETPVINQATVYADVGVSMSGSPNPVLASNQLTYSITVNNLGAANAPAVVLTDSLPANVTFSSATVSQGSYTLIPGGVQWNVGALADGASATATIVILPLQTGQIENTATVSLTPTVPPVVDNDPDNNTAEVFTTVTGSAITNATIVYGSVTFNPQTGLYEQTVTYNNVGQAEATKTGEVTPPPAEAVRVYVLDLPSFVQLYNATGTANGSPYVEYENTVPSGGSVNFLLEYYDSTRAAFVSTNFTYTAVAAVTVPLPTGTSLQLDRTPFLSNGQLTIEFATVPGHTYVVEYSSDMMNWSAAVPAIVAKNTRTVWVDGGPPVTSSAPGAVGDRYYRVVQTN
jgi:uncharacterized repeat protein (TIGR01451 family)